MYGSPGKQLEQFLRGWGLKKVSTLLVLLGFTGKGTYYMKASYNDFNVQEDLDI